MGLEGELELLRILRRNGLSVVHGLEQRRISEFLPEMNDPARQRVAELLRANRMLPRSKLTYQIDLLAWKRGHWAALAIEQKNQNGVTKVLDINKDSVVLNAVCGNSTRPYARSGRDLWLQCRGEAYLGKAFMLANDVDAEVIPVGVVDYEIRANRIPVDWAYHRNVFFVRSDRFPWFLGQYLDNTRWLLRTVTSRPDLTFGACGEIAS